MRFLKGERRGQTLVEFALILPIFVVILVGIFDGGRLVFANHTVNNAAREGGREATVNQTLVDIRARAAQHAVSLDIAPADIAVTYLPTVPGQDCSSAAIQAESLQSVGCLAVVQVPYTYFAATPVIGALIGPIDLMGEVRFPVEFNCVDQPGKDCPLGL